MIQKFYKDLIKNFDSNNNFYRYFNEHYSYADLKRFYLKFSNIVSLLKKKRSTICIMSDKCFELYATSLSVVLSNNIWVPISMTSPEGRVCEIIDVLKPDVFIVQNSNNLKITGIKKYLEKKKIYVISFDEIYKAEPLLKFTKHNYLPNDTAMIFFTSGSTGKPKGVKLSHISYISCLKEQINKLYINQKNLVFGDYHDISFVISLNILFPCFFLKATISPGISISDILFPFNHLFKNNVNTLITVPTTINRAKNELKKFTNKLKLKILILCGEPFYFDLYKFLINRNLSRNIFNCYGSTELSPWVFCHKLNKRNSKIIKKYNVVPIGQKFDGVFIKIVGNSLFVGGKTLSKGYLLQSQNNGIFKKINGYKYYKTNDIVKKVNKNYFILGRSDSLVKILGYRVELYEIEKRLRNINYITNSYVFVKEHNKYKKIICACVETNKTSKVHIMKQLKINLPSYMIPKEIKLIKKFPLNKSFKIDRQILKKKFSR